MGLLQKLFGDASVKEVNKLRATADRVIELQEELGLGAKSDEELREMTTIFRQRLAGGETLDDILPEAFAVCREAAKRAVGMEHFPVQIIGGIILHQGRISEMKTGEGKTFVATLPAYLNALEGKGVHVVTVNDYLAKRDAEWMGRIYRLLGLSVGVVVHGVKNDDRRAAYNADITYGTNNEFGFDYLRDNMAKYKENLVQRDLNYAIIDEVDSILIDEARTPLIISVKGDPSTELYKKADDFVRSLSGKKIIKEKKGPLMALGAEEDPDEENFDYIFEEKDNQVALTERGIKRAEKFFGLETYGDPENMEINHHVVQALKAHSTMERDVDYIVKDGEIIIVDEFTGRLMFGRRFSNGLHQAIEAKEHVEVKSESKTMATITLQNYFRMYEKLAGMTGTAKTEEEEFREIYNMDVVEIPTNKEVIREDLSDSIYQTERGKFKAIVDRIVEVHETGQPILVGTISIEKSELLSDMLSKRGVKHNVLNAKQHDKEAEIVAEAGRKGKVTIATNMAGRGTDIILGGNPEFEARKELEKLEYTPEQIEFALSRIKSNDPELNSARDKYNEILSALKVERDKEHEEVVALGGLCIIGSERHESRRIDNQLRGRAGRQGDPGMTQFYISMEDDLMRLFGGDRMQGLIGKIGMEEDQALEAGVLTKTIENAQKRVESKNFGIRKYVLQYDNVMNKQREIIYGERRRVLFGEDLRDYIMNMRDGLVDTMLDSTTAESKYPEGWDLESLDRNLKKLFNEYTIKDWTDEKRAALTKETLRDDILGELDKIYEAKENEIGAVHMRNVERMILMRVVDNMWQEHIDAMDQMKSGIGLRAIGQMDPAAEYAKEGFDMFEEMIGAIQEDTVKYCYSITMETSENRGGVIVVGDAKKDDYVDEEVEAAKAAMAAAAAGKGGSGKGGKGMKGMPKDTPIPPRQVKPETYKREQPKVGRNDPCPCGSGKKYKNCCGRQQAGADTDDI
ncbi:MAG: preprotein translocase subunit SecA [Firmicutes bacterium]|nr:preprotein translocase subunit SecA [Bacillota bacterium]